MGFLDSLRKLAGRGDRGPASSGGGRSAFGDDDPGAYWIYAQCRRCGELLTSRVNLADDPSLSDDGEGWIVRKGLIGSGATRCFQTVEVTLKFDAKKQKVVESEVVGGKLLTADEYRALADKAQGEEHAA